MRGRERRASRDGRDEGPPEPARASSPRAGRPGALSRALRPDLLPRTQAVLLFAVGVWSVLLAIRGLGLLQPLELRAYDGFLSLSTAGAASEERIAVVAIREGDLARHGWPVRDDRLADLLERLLATGARVVGVDLFRDRPEEPGHDRLAALLAAEPLLIVATKYPGRQDPGVPPPPAVEDRSRVGFVDTLVDEDGTVRRGLLFLGGGGSARWSMGLRLALAWLDGRGIGLAASDPSDAAAPPRLGQALLRRLPPDPVGYVGADPGGWQFLMTYPFGRSPPPVFGFDEVLGGRVPDAAFRDRMVLVGTTADTVKDQFLTPLVGGRSSYGVLLHAQVASQLVREALGEAGPLLPLAPWPDRFWALAWCILGALAASLLHGRGILLVAGALVGTAVLVGGAALAFVLGCWIGVVPPLAGGLGALVLVTIHLDRREAAERDALARLFAVHLSSRIADYLWSERAAFLERGRARPQFLEATVLFSDVRDFTGTAERLSPSDLIEWLNEYFSRMAEEVARYGGIVNQFLGDGLMAVFGPPFRRTPAESVADARAAVDCALAMRRSVEDLAARFRARGLPEVRIRVGIHKGPLVAGSIGSADRLQYALVGDTVNIAARLESWREPRSGAGCEADHCRILVSEAVFACLGAAYATIPAGAVRLKGKSHPVVVHRIIGSARPADHQEGPVPCARQLPVPSRAQARGGAAP